MPKRIDRANPDLSDLDGRQLALFDPPRLHDPFDLNELAFKYTFKQVQMPLTVPPILEARRTDVAWDVLRWCKQCDGIGTLNGWDTPRRPNGRMWDDHCPACINGWKIDYSLPLAA